MDMVVTGRKVAASGLSTQRSSIVCWIYSVCHGNRCRNARRTGMTLVISGFPVSVSPCGW